MRFWNKICGFILTIFFFSFSCTAQEKFSKKYFISPNLLSQQYKTPAKYIINTQDFINIHSIIPQDYYTRHFGYMCKKELAIEKATKIPFRFRLGSLQQCNYLEGKK